MLKIFSYIFLFVYPCLLLHTTYAQSSPTDSLYSKIKKLSDNDTLKVQLSLQLARKFWYNKTDSARTVSEHALKIAERLNYERGIASCYNSFGTIYDIQGNHSEAVRLHKKALAIQIQLNDLQGQAQSYNHLGVSARRQAQYPKSIAYYLKSLQIREKLKDLDGIATAYCNMAAIYDEQKNYEKSEKYNLKALSIFQQIKDVDAEILAYSSLATMYRHWGKLQESLLYHKKSLAIINPTTDVSQLARAYINIGVAYTDLKKYDSALYYQKKALVIEEKRQNNEGIMYASANIAEILLFDKQYQEAEKLLNKGIALNQQYHDAVIQEFMYQLLAQLYAAQGKYKDALLYTEKATVIKDSLFSSQKNTEIHRLQTEYAEAQHAVTVAQQESRIVTLQQEKQRQYILLVATIIVLATSLLSGYLFHRNKNLLKEKETRLLQDQLIEQLQTNEVLQQQMNQELAEKVQERSEKVQLQEQLIAQLQENEKLQKQINSELEILVAARTKEVLAVQADNQRIQQEKLEHRERELMSMTLLVAQKSEFLQRIDILLDKVLSNQLEEVKKEIQSIKKELQHSNTMENDWDKFKLHFEQVHPQFFDKLSAICPALTVNELRQCAYIKMNLSIKEIAALLNVTDGAIKIARNRMKKKIGLSQDDSLGEFLQKLYINLS